MFGFKKREEKNNVSDSGQINAQTIPDIFYGGNDPDIYKSPIGVVVQNNGSGSTAGASKLNNGSGIKKKKIVLIVVLSLLLLGAIGAISWYYLRSYFIACCASPVIVQETPIVTTSTVKTEVILPTSTPIEISIPTTTPPVLAPVPTSTISMSVISDFPPEILIDASDFDADSLTDSEEEVFETDMSLWDTDNDGYYDGQEINNLYNPKGFAPVKLIDSGLVREYVSAIWGYRTYYPTKWQVGGVDNEGRQVLFSDAGGDYIEVRIINKNQGEEFVTWFGNHTKGQKIEALLQMQNRFETNIWKRNDDLVAYIPGPNWVAVLVYHPLINSPIKSRHIMQMAVQGFRVGASIVQIPSQAVLPSTLPTSNIVNNDGINNTTTLISGVNITTTTTTNTTSF